MSRRPYIEMYAELQICTTKVHKFLSDDDNHVKYESLQRHSKGGKQLSSKKSTKKLSSSFTKVKSRKRRINKVISKNTKQEVNTSIYTLYDVVRARIYADQLSSISRLYHKLQVIAKKHNFNIHLFKRVKVTTCSNMFFYKCVFCKKIQLSSSQTIRLLMKVCYGVSSYEKNFLLPGNSYPLLPFIQTSITANCKKFRRDFKNMVNAFVF